MINYGPRMKPLSSELQSAYAPSALAAINKQELRTFEALQRTLRVEEDWLSFVKLFKLYLDGIIGQKDFVTLIDAKFDTRIGPDLKNDLVNLLPSRDAQRRVNSNILKPWNDLEN